MRFTITQKLLTVVSLPILTLLIFSIYHINDKYSLLTNNERQLINLNIMKKTNNLIHEVQLERGLSANVLGRNDDLHFRKQLSIQTKKTDSTIQLFQSLIEKLQEDKISKTTQRYLNEVKRILNEISTIRNSINNYSISQKESFEYFTVLNTQLIRILNSFKVVTHSPKINSDIFALSRIIQLQEYAGQERGFVSNLIAKKELGTQEFRKYYSIISAQNEEEEQMLFILNDSSLKKSANKIYNKYAKSDLEIYRKRILDHEEIDKIQNEIYQTIGFGGMLHYIIKYQRTNNEEFYQKFLLQKEKFNLLINKYLAFSNLNAQNYSAAQTLREYFDDIVKDKTKPVDDIKIYKLWKTTQNYQTDINPISWFDITTQRINEIYNIEKELFDEITANIKNSLSNTKTELKNQIFITLTTILLLLIGSFIVSNKIKKSIAKLETGLDNFFKFLNFEGNKPETIITNSNDEVNDIAQRINVQIETTEAYLEEDLYFIKEITQIVTLMKDGDFSERPYFEPNNPNLVELKAVFNELIELIAQKIKEQTTSLERLNSSLEDKVFNQTVELQKQVEELTVARDKAIQAEIAKDEFLANMSHEIRTPLNAILGFVTILKKKTKEEKSLNYLNIIDTSGKSLLTIINDILDFSKIQSGKFTITPHEINPVDVFSNATSLFASKAYEKHLIYAVYIDPNLPKVIKVDDIRVKQILSNVLSNAIKFTPEDGSIKVKVIIKNDLLIISVQDSGIGISKENQTKIFSSFEQADGSTTRKYGGTGLGLSISSKLSKLMNGTLTVSSEENKGSTFTLEIPIETINLEPNLLIKKEIIQDYTFALLNKCPDSSPQMKVVKKYLTDFGAQNILEIDSYQEDGYDILFFIPDEEFNEAIVHSNKPTIAILRTTFIKLGDHKHIKALYSPLLPTTIVNAINDLGLRNIKPISTTPVNEVHDKKYTGQILVAEDNKTNQMLISLILDDYGIKYKIADDGLKAIESFKEYNYNLILMDENMPELNGIGAMKIIKQYEKDNNLEKTPIVALTASVLDSDKEKFISAGMDGFLGKPIDTKELEAVLDKYLTTNTK